MAKKAKKIKEVKKVLSFSWTKIQDFEACPFMFKMKHIEKKVQETNPLMIVGRVVHNAINIYNRHCLNNKLEQDFEKWEECAYLALRQENLEAEHYPEVLEMVKNYASHHVVALESAVGAEETIAINRKGEQVDWEAPDVFFRFMIDFLQIAGDVAKITDYKAGWLMDAPRFQLEIYAWGVKQVYKHVSMFEIELDFVRHEWQKTFTIEEDELATIEKKIMSKVFLIENETKFEPKLGKTCAYCGCWNLCPAMKAEERMFTMPMNDKEAQELAVKIEKHTKLRTEATDILKIYCDNHGAVVAGGKEYGFTVSSTWEISDINDFIVKCEEAGIDLLDCLTIDNRKLKRRLKDVTVQKIVEAIGRKKVGVSFKGKKCKPKDDLAPIESNGLEGDDADKKD